MDAQAAGIQWEGEDGPQLSIEDKLAAMAVKTLSNVMGGIDWAGLPFVVEWLGVEDVGDLMHRITVIKNHEPPERDEDKH